MKFFDTFAGIGGFTIPLVELGHECVGYSEIDKHAIAIYERHFPSHKNFGDITKIDPAALPGFDILCGGFPCQAFSIAGKRRGFEDTRGTLFFDIARILRAKKPRLCLLENVKGLLSHDDGRTFKTIIATLDELGYDAEWQLLDSFFFNAAPRQRLYVLAMHREQKIALGKRQSKTLSLHPCLCEGARNTDTSSREQEVVRGSERAIRTFVRLPDWLDSWDSFYSPQT